MSALPLRPRLADHAMARRHFIDGEEIVVVHDTRSGDLVRMPPRAWALIEAADGTRDLAGLLLAASQKGAHRRSAEVSDVLAALHGAGLLTDGIDPFALEPPASVCPPDAPLDVLPFAFTCDGSGACCATYATVRFTEAESERARALLPDASAGRARVFLPLAGSGAQRSRAATLIDGACSYLAGDGACELHRAGGVSAKPSGCAIYPATFVFDGEVVRVSLGFECACVAKSVGRAEGLPLAPEGAATRADLPREAQVSALPEAIEIAPGVTTSRASIAAWSRAAVKLPHGVDVVAALWALAAKALAGDVSSEGVAAALRGASPPAEAELAPWIAALAEKTEAKRESAEKWRSPRDRVRLLGERLATVAASLRDPGVLARPLAGEGATPDLERFHLTASLHGHALVGDVPLAHALRDRAVRVLLARAMRLAPSPAEVAVAGSDDPLPLVEVMMRAQGVKDYVRAIP